MRGIRQCHVASGHMVIPLLAVLFISCPGLVARADGYAKAAPPLEPVSASGLADHRAYEEVTPASKNGNYVASGGVTATEKHGYAAASADGDALVFLGSGAMGGATSSILGPYVARRSPSGWSTSSATPPQVGVVIIGDPNLLIPSTDFSRFVFGSQKSYSPEQPLGPSKSVNLYLTENPAVAPAWLGKPTIPNSIPLPGANTGGTDYIVAGGTPSLSTVYFSYSGTLTAQDASRAPNVGQGTGGGTHPWGFYEWAEGTLNSAGVLPDGTLSPFGATLATVAGDAHDTAAWQAGDFNNEVSSDGARAFFVSPDPVASTTTNPGGCEAEGPCATTPPELYVRETLPSGAKQTLLVSQSQLPGHLGQPAPHGPTSVTDALVERGAPIDSSDVYASPDGGHAFFASIDQLTSQAPEDTSVKEYDFNLENGSLTYLPGVVGPIVATARDGSDLLFKNTSTSPVELDLWRAGASGGEITSVAQLPEATDIGLPYTSQGGVPAIGIEARASTDGSAFAFDTNAPLPGFDNNQSGYGEVYRYDVASNSVTCVSCAPVGVIPSGNALISYDNQGGGNSKPRSTVDTRVMSADGERIFFDTPDLLLSQDGNGKRDVYEWEQDGAGTCHERGGCITLISAGTSTEDTFYLDSSASGDDVFFNTSVGLASNDTDEAYDAYDARVAHPGDILPPSQPAPCTGAACQLALSTPSLLGLPASATISGLGNVTPTKTKAKPSTKKKPKKKHRRKKHRSPASRGKAGRHVVGRSQGGSR
jgi:hypothetical protein